MSSKYCMWEPFMNSMIFMLKWSPLSIARHGQIRMDNTYVSICPSYIYGCAYGGILMDKHHMCSNPSPYSSVKMDPPWLDIYPSSMDGNDTCIWKLSQVHFWDRTLDGHCGHCVCVHILWMDMMYVFKFSPHLIAKMELWDVHPRLDGQDPLVDGPVKCQWTLVWVVSRPFPRWHLWCLLMSPKKEIHIVKKERWDRHGLWMATMHMF